MKTGNLILGVKSNNTGALMHFTEKFQNEFNLRIDQPVTCLTAAGYEHFLVGC